MKDGKKGLELFLSHLLVVERTNKSVQTHKTSDIKCYRRVNLKSERSGDLTRNIFLVTGESWRIHVLFTDKMNLQFFAPRLSQFSVV